MNKHYKLRYDLNFEPGKWEKKDAEGKGLTDALLVVSVLTSGDKAHEGSMSVGIISVDGRTSKPGNPIPQPPTEMFSIWSMFGH